MEGAAQFGQFCEEKASWTAGTLGRSCCSFSTQKEQISLITPHQFWLKKTFQGLQSAFTKGILLEDACEVDWRCCEGLFRWGWDSLLVQMWNNFIWNYRVCVAQPLHVPIAGISSTLRTLWTTAFVVHWCVNGSIDSWLKLGKRRKRMLASPRAWFVRTQRCRCLFHGLLVNVVSLVSKTFSFQP